MTATEGALHAYLSREAKEAWTAFGATNGVSITGLLEALGLELAEEDEEAEDHRIDWVKSARRIDAQRRQRTRR